jgi:Dyp-type peroxidase family
MSKLDATDIQGFVLRGYVFPFARFLFLHIPAAENGRKFVLELAGKVTTGQLWDNQKPRTTLNIAFTYAGLSALGLPQASLQSFPVEFVQGMKARGGILGDVGRNSPDHWDPFWQQDPVHVWLGVYAESPGELDQKTHEIEQLAVSTGGAVFIGMQNAGLLVVNGEPGPKEHFGYTDGFGNPDYLGVQRDTQPGQGKLSPDGKSWLPLATGELLLGYADEAGEIPVAPVPHLLANNGTFMVYRKLHQNVATFRDYMKKKSAQYGCSEDKLKAKFVGRWPDGTPLELSPDSENPDIVKEKKENVNFVYGQDLQGERCPLGAHIRRANPRDAFGFKGRLVNRRRISRRGMPYGEYLPEDQPADDDKEHGIAFMALNASIFRQFEFVQQQWIDYGNDAHQGNDKDALLGNHGDQGRFMIQGSDDPASPPFICGELPNFVELRGGDYFFLPSITALRMIGAGAVDPR